MKTNYSDSWEESTPKDSTTNPLDAIARRVAIAAESKLVEKLPSFAENWLSTDPDVRQNIRLLCQAEIRSLSTQLHEQWTREAGDFRLTQEQLAEAERKFLRSQAAESRSQLTELLAANLGRLVQTLAWTAIVIGLVLALVVVTPVMVHTVWEPPQVSALSNENQTLRTQIALLQAQPALQQSVMLYSLQDGIWAEVEKGAAPSYSQLIVGAPAIDRLAWMIRLKPRRSS